MKSIGPGVREIRVRHQGQYRTIYVANRGDDVYVLHVFKKTTQRTPETRHRVVAATAQSFGDQLMDEDLKITPASENIFEDLGFSKAEAAVLYAKTTLQIELGKEIKRRGLTQIAAAELLGVSRARLNRLMQGKLDKVSIDKLVAMCAQLDRRVALKVTRRKRSAVA